MTTLDTRLIDIADYMMSALVTGLTTAGISVPSRRYIHAGEIAHDFEGTNCAEELVISFAGMQTGIAGTDGFGVPLPMKCAVPLTAAYVIDLTRCVPTLSASGKAPLASALQASATEVLTDSMTLPAVIVDLQLANLLVPLPCSMTAFNSILPIGPEGALGGVSVSILVALV